MRMARPAVTLCALLTAGCTSFAQFLETGAHPEQPLGDIVGVWQSDTTAGNSALSDCAWTPQHGAVICEQTISTPTGIRHAQNLFTVDLRGNRFAFYGLSQPGDPMRPVPLSIDSHIWIYGGTAPDSPVTWSRTVNDFNATGTYTWRQESSLDGQHWTAGGAHGLSRRLK